MARSLAGPSAKEITKSTSKAPYVQPQDVLHYKIESMSWEAMDTGDFDTNIIQTATKQTFANCLFQECSINIHVQIKKPEV